MTAQANLGSVIEYVNMMWLSSRSIGCGTVVSSDRKCLVTACYTSSAPVSTDVDYNANIRRPNTTFVRVTNTSTGA